MSEEDILKINQGPWQIVENGRLEAVITLRDQFAMAALTGLIAADTIYYSVGPIVKEAYEAADAMIEARK